MVDAVKDKDEPEPVWPFGVPEHLGELDGQL